MRRKTKVHMHLSSYFYRTKSYRSICKQSYFYESDEDMRTDWKICQKMQDGKVLYLFNDGSTKVVEFENKTMQVIPIDRIVICAYQEEN